MIFEFNNQLKAQNSIDIPNIGSFAIRASNDDGYDWYFVMVTSMGTSTYVSFGPTIYESGEIPCGYTCHYDQMEFKEVAIEKMVSKWLNDFKKKITDAKLVDYDEAISNMAEVQKYMFNIEPEMSYDD